MWSATNLRPPLLSRDAFVNFFSPIPKTYLHIDLKVVALNRFASEY